MPYYKVLFIGYIIYLFIDFSIGSVIRELSLQLTEREAADAQRRTKRNGKLGISRRTGSNRLELGLTWKPFRSYVTHSQ